MRQSRFSEAEMVAIVKEREDGASVPELCRKHGISIATFYKWRARHGVRIPVDIDRIRRLERENVALRQLLTSVLAENLCFRNADCGNADH